MDGDCFVGSGLLLPIWCVKFGLSLIMRGREATRSNALALALYAEEHGYDSVYVSDHFVIPKRRKTMFGGRDTDFPAHWREGYLESITTLAYVAGHTRTVRLGVSALVLPLRNPIQLARQVATLDLMSEGRADLVVTAGYAEDEFDVMRVPFEDRGERTEEYVRLIKAMWSSSPATFTGTYFSFEDMSCGPLPIQDPFLPVAIGGFSISAMRRAARVGDGWHPAARPLTGLRSDVARFNQELTEAGRPASEVPITLKLPSLGFDPIADPEWGADPDTWIERFQEYETLGVRRVVIDYAVESDRGAFEVLDRFERDVRPSLGDVGGHSSPVCDDTP